VQFPVSLWLGPLAIHPHWVFETLAYLVGAALFARARTHSRDPIDPVHRGWILAAACLGAALGSKVLVALDHPTLVLHALAQPVTFLEGKTVVGALLGGLIAVEWTKTRLGIARATGDVFALPLAVGIAIGRIGCFLSGLDDETYGVPASLPWAIDFGDGVPRHPTQLYEIAFLVLALLPGLVWLGRRPHRQGDLFKLFMVGYLAFRLGVEFLKPGELVLGLSAIQWACVAGLAWYAHSLRAWRSARPEPLGVIARG
jgi:prolipoprotein diacylglyceryltransferase